MNKKFTEVLVDIQVSPKDSNNISYLPSTSKHRLSLNSDNQKELLRSLLKCLTDVTREFAEHDPGDPSPKPADEQSKPVIAEAMRLIHNTKTNPKIRDIVYP